jgi:hypothetical protein
MARWQRSPLGLAFRGGGNKRHSNSLATGPRPANKLSLELNSGFLAQAFDETIRPVARGHIRGWPTWTANGVHALWNHRGDASLRLPGAGSSRLRQPTGAGLCSLKRDAADSRWHRRFSNWCGAISPSSMRLAHASMPLRSSATRPLRGGTALRTRCRDGAVGA